MTPHDLYLKLDDSILPAASGFQQVTEGVLGKNTLLTNRILQQVAGTDVRI